MDVCPITFNIYYANVASKDFSSTLRYFFIAICPSGAESQDFSSNLWDILHVLHSWGFQAEGFSCSSWTIFIVAPSGVADIE